MREAVIVSTARTPMTKSHRGEFNVTPAAQLAAFSVRAAVERSGVDPAMIEDLILGCGNPDGFQGRNLGRQAVLRAELPLTIAGTTITRYCASGLQAIAAATGRIVAEGVDAMIAGGVETISGLRPGNNLPTDMDPWLVEHKPALYMAMIDTADIVAKRYAISREDQDAFALQSQQRTAAAQAADLFKDEIIPFTVKTRKGDTVVEADEYIRHGATLDSMQKLRPAFTKDGSVTAANASGINDGAAAVLIMSEEEAAKRGLKVLARIASYATAGLDPSIMGVGPIFASRKALDKAGWKVADLDLVEANEAFAAQACAVNKDMGWDPAIVNVNGGAIAIGHPIGASGARVLNTLLFEMGRSGAKKGLATLCIGGGMGVAMCLERG